MLTTVSVVVILGAIIAAITHAVLADEEQPATAGHQRDRDDAVAADDLTSATGPTTLDDEPVAVWRVEPDEPDDLPRFRLESRSAQAVLAALAPEPEGDTLLLPAEDLRVRGRASVPVPAAGDEPLWDRIRSVLLLAALIVVIGAVGAAALGVVVIGGAALVDQTLG